MNIGKLVRIASSLQDDFDFDIGPVEFMVASTTIKDYDMVNLLSNRVPDMPAEYNREFIFKMFDFLNSYGLSGEEYIDPDRTDGGIMIGIMGSPEGIDNFLESEVFDGFGRIKHEAIRKIGRERKYSAGVGYLERIFYNKKYREREG